MNYLLLVHCLSLSTSEWTDLCPGVCILVKLIANDVNGFTKTCQRARCPSCSVFEDDRKRLEEIQWQDQKPDLFKLVNGYTSTVQSFKYYAQQTIWNLSYGDKITIPSSSSYKSFMHNMFKYYFQLHLQSSHDYESSGVDIGSPYTSSVLTWPTIIPF